MFGQTLAIIRNTFFESIRQPIMLVVLVVATIALKGEGFIARVKKRPDCRVVTVTVDNRGQWPDALLQDVLRRL